MNAGFAVDTVLEMTEDMCENNAYHFVKNYPDIKVLKPSEWQTMSFSDIDVLCANPPCSGLSAINRNANIGNDVNKHIYEVVDQCLKIKPKVLFIENAPTLTNLGLPILKDLCTKLNNDYRVLIINDLAKNHNVAMHRRRTFFIAFRRDVFNGIPNIEANCQSPVSLLDVIKDNNSSFNNNLDEDRLYPSFERYYNLVQPGESILTALARELPDDLNEAERRVVTSFKDRQSKKDSIWDKTAYRPKDLAPSMTSLAQIIHPIENRDLTIREYAKLMGYPDSFEFFDGGHTKLIQCMAQGVPVKFIEYIASEIKDALDGNKSLAYNVDVLYINQCSGVQHKTKFNTLNEFLSTDNITVNNSEALQEINLW